MTIALTKNEEVAVALRPDHDWRTAYPFVEERAKFFLNGRLNTLTTTALADLIYGPDEAHDPKVRKRVFQALKALSTRGLAAYVTLGEPETIGASQGARRRHWHAPRIGSVQLAQQCPTCKRPI